MRRRAEPQPAPAVLPGQLDAWAAQAEFSEGDRINDRYWVMHRRPGGVNDVYLCVAAGTWDHVAVKIPRPRGPAAR